MVAHNLLRRQLGPEAPTASGLQNSATFVDTAILASATSVLVFDSAAPSGTLSAPPLVFGSSEPTHTPTSSSRSTSSSADPSASIEAASGSSNTISMSTVIGACVGAFIGAVAFVILAIFFYRRYSRSLKQRSQRNLPRSPYVDGRSGRGEEDRRRSKSWNRLDDKDADDQWEGMPPSANVPPAREMNTLEPMEKLDMFQKTPSTVSHRSEEPAFEMKHPYSNPSSIQRLPEARDLLGREPQNLLGGIDSGPTISWASESKGSFLSATRLEGGAMSPTLTMAIPTPAATRSEPHHWESAELVNFSEGHTAEIVTSDPSDNNYNARESLHNPFFSGKPDYIVRRRSGSRSSSHSRSSRSRSSSSAATIQQQHVVSSPTTPTEKGKERVVSLDPFRDPLPKPSFIHHLPTGSAASSASNDRAIRQLLAATGMEDMNSDEVQRRLKAASMQPSIISNSGDSMYTDAEPDPADQRLMMEFPIPPSSSGHETIAR